MLQGIISYHATISHQKCKNSAVVAGVDLSGRLPTTNVEKAKIDLSRLCKDLPSERNGQPHVHSEAEIALPVVPVMDAVWVELEAIAWRDGLKAK
jgi:hypothetical protein